MIFNTFLIKTSIKNQFFKKKLSFLTENPKTAVFGKVFIFINMYETYHETRHIYFFFLCLFFLSLFLRL
jgi:hypothetical protein